MVHFGKWPVAIIASVVLLWHRQDAISVLSLLWPILSGFFAIPGKRGLIEMNFARNIGYVQDINGRVLQIKTSFLQYFDLLLSTRESVPLRSHKPTHFETVRRLLKLQD